MRKVIISMLALLMAGQLHSQVAHWIIRPDYDSIYFSSGANFIVTDSLNDKNVWTLDGKRLFKTTDQLYPFNEGFAVTTEQNSNIITGFYNLDGKFTSIEGGCSISHNYPYFSDGYLVVEKDDKYYLADTKGKLKTQGFVLVYPFHHGFASCRNYKNPDRPRGKEIISFLINDKDGQELSFSFGGKRFSRDDLEFISSVNDEGIGIIVAKHRVYRFVGENQDLQPVLFPGDNDLKNQAKLEGKISECLQELGKSNHYVLYAKCGESTLSILFDAIMVPVEIRYNTEVHPFECVNTTKENRTSSLTIIKDKENNLSGISIDGTEILPIQFESVYKCFDNKAFVKMSGKQGLICISKDENFHPTINDGKAIGFRHQTFNTTIRLDMPSFIPSERTFIESLDPICFIDQISKESKNTSRGNYIQYASTLSFPENLTDETTEISYPIQIISDGIKFPVVELKANAWHYKYFTIQINESGRTVNKGVASFTFDINAERFSDDDVYPFIVNIVTDSVLYAETEALSSTHYKCTVYGLKEGPNDITIEVLEKGCPPISSTYRLTYVKPSAKNKHKENIDIKKRTDEDKLNDELKWRY